jgi:hypothetical protein
MVKRFSPEALALSAAVIDRYSRPEIRFGRNEISDLAGDRGACCEAMAELARFRKKMRRDSKRARFSIPEIVEIESELITT